MTFTESSILVDASLLIEYWYCPRFIYFMKVLGIGQHEEDRLKVRMGREVHQKKALQPRYLRKKLGVTTIERNVYLSSPRLGICGILDELLHFEDGSFSLLDYKFAYNKHKFKTQFLQGVFYSLLIEENFHTRVNRFYIVYTRERNNLEKYDIGEPDKKEVLDTVEKVRRIIGMGLFPASTKYKKRCGDCTYRNLCIQ